MAGDLRCPADGRDLSFGTFEFNGRIVPYHSCTQCEGCFVGGDDLRNFAGDAHIPLVWDRGAATPRDAWRHCPTCVRGLEPVGLERIQLDVCGSCAGVWFDKGELKKLRQRGKRDYFTAAPGKKSGGLNGWDYLFVGWLLGSLLNG